MNTFQNSRHMILQHCHFHSDVRYHHCEDEKPLQMLFGASQLDAIHDSAARERALESTPTTTHPEFVNIFTSWSTAQKPGCSPSMALLTGPISDLAQLCAEHLEDYLAATYFLSSGSCTADPVHFIPTIALQLATRSPSFAEALKNIIHRDPTLLTKSLKVQFRELIAVPFRDLTKSVGASNLMGRVIIVDAFDRFAPRIRREILRAIATAIDEETPQLCWAFFSEEDYNSVRGEIELILNTKDLLLEVNLYDSGPGAPSEPEYMNPGWTMNSRFLHIVLHLCLAFLYLLNGYIFSPDI